MQVLVAIALGILLGWLKPDWAITLKPVGEGFVRLIKMLIGPIIFTTVVAGISGMGNLKRVGRVGAKAMLWFELVTTVALVLAVIMRLAPIGAFGAMAFTIGTYGVGTLGNLIGLMLTFYATALLFV